MIHWDIKAGNMLAFTHDGKPTAKVGGRDPHPSAAIVDSCTLQSLPESGQRAGYDGTKRKKGSKAHSAVDTLGHLLALHVTAADEQDRSRVKQLAKEVQKVTGKSVEVAIVRMAGAFSPAE